MKRKCSHCGREKPLTAFRIDRRIKSGYFTDCRECQDMKRRMFDKAAHYERQ